MRAGRRARAASRSNSRSTVPRYSTTRGGSRSSPSRSASVSGRPWGSTYPTTTSRPVAPRPRAVSSMAYVFPTPAAAPRKTFSFPRRPRACSACTLARRASGSGRCSLTGLSGAGFEPPRLPLVYLRQDSGQIVTIGAHGAARGIPSSARLSASTFTRDSPSIPSCRLSTWASPSCRTRPSSSPRALATRRTW
jgi:hypothetical protein